MAAGPAIRDSLREADLKRRRRDAALKKLTAEEVDALGLGEIDFEELDRKAREKRRA